MAIADRQDVFGHPQVNKGKKGLYTFFSPIFLSQPQKREYILFAGTCMTVPLNMCVAITIFSLLIWV